MTTKAHDTTVDNLDATLEKWYARLLPLAEVVDGAAVTMEGATIDSPYPGARVQQAGAREALRLAATEIRRIANAIEVTIRPMPADHPDTLNARSENLL